MKRKSEITIAIVMAVLAVLGGTVAWLAAPFQSGCRRFFHRHNKFFGSLVRPIHLVRTGVPIYLPEILRNNLDKGPNFRWEVLTIWIKRVNRIFAGQEFAQKRDQRPGFKLVCHHE